MEEGFETALLTRLEKWLVAYSRVFLIPCENGTVDTFAAAVLRAATESPRILGASAAGGMEKTERDGVSGMLLLSAVPPAEKSGFTYGRITEEEQEQLLRLYHMYEFSDKFSVIGEEGAYGGLSRLVETGVISMEEAAEALFMYR